MPSTPPAPQPSGALKAWRHWRASVGFPCPVALTDAQRAWPIVMGRIGDEVVCVAIERAIARDAASAAAAGKEKKTWEKKT